MHATFSLQIVLVLQTAAGHMSNVSLPLCLMNDGRPIHIQLLISSIVP